MNKTSITYIRLVLCILSLGPSIGHASVFDTHGFGARAIAMSNAVSALTGISRVFITTLRL